MSLPKVLVDGGKNPSSYGIYLFKNEILSDDFNTLMKVNIRPEMTANQNVRHQ